MTPPENVKVVWQYRSSDDKTWKDMPELYSNLHEKLYQNDAAYFEYDVQYPRSSKYYLYKVDLIEMLQTNVATGKSRSIRRTTAVTMPDETNEALATTDVSMITDK